MKVARRPKAPAGQAALFGAVERPEPKPNSPENVGFPPGPVEPPPTAVVTPGSTIPAPSAPSPWTEPPDAQEPELEPWQDSLFTLPGGGSWERPGPAPIEKVFKQKSAPPSSTFPLCPTSRIRREYGAECLTWGGEVRWRTPRYPEGWYGWRPHAANPDYLERFEEIPFDTAKDGT